MASKNPTNSDILQELRAMNGRLASLENWRIAEDAAKKAVAEYKRTEAVDNQTRDWTAVAKQLAPFLVALTALAYALIQRIGQ